jgi:hypothetical protein
MALLKPTVLDSLLSPFLPPFLDIYCSMKAGYSMNVYSRTKSKCDSLVEAGATWHSTAASLAKDSDIIFRYVQPKEAKSLS